MSRLVLLFALCLLCAVSNAQNPVDPNVNRAPLDTLQNRENLIGTWFLSQKTTKGGLWRVLATLTADGKYTMNFEEYLDGRRIRKYTETGLWGVSGDVHFTITQGGMINGESYEVPPERPGNYLAYRIVALNSSTFVYDSVVSGNRFRSRKVPDDYVFRPPR
ncbi:MAG: hypothetical protein AAGA44_03490 [Pseudomonadota bacterium]